MHYIYLIQNKLNNKLYIGQTNSTISHRFAQHTYDAKSRKFTYPLYNAINKYGIANFSVIELETHDTQDEANDAEEFFIQYFQARNKSIGYNIKPGGKVSGHSAETIAKISASNKGKKRSPEAVENNRKAQLGRKQSEDQKAKAAKQMLGNTHALGSKGRLGQKNTEEHLNKMRLARLGKLNPRSEAIANDVVADYPGLTISQLAIKYGVMRATIRNILKKKAA